MFYLMDQPTREQFEDLARRYEDMRPDAVRAMVRLLRVGSDLMAAFERMLGRYGLSQSRFLVLLVLNRNPSQPMAPSEISERVGVTRATMTRLLESLEREGLIMRRANEADGRRQDLSLTPQGLALLERILPDYWRRAARLMGALTGEERATLYCLLDKTAGGIAELTREEPAPGGFEIRPYRDGDEAGIGALISGIQQGEFGMSITLYDQPDLADIPGFYLHGAGGFWTAREDRAGGRIVGTVALVDIGQGFGALRKMFVDKDWRGAQKGAAAALLRTLLDHARAKGLTGIYLGTTAHFVAAHRFYARQGFSEIAREALPPSFPVMAVDTRFFMIEL